MSEERFPLAWPAGRTRTKFRASSAFGEHSIASARDAVLRELARLGAKDPVVSTNVRVRLDGLLRSDSRVEGGDPGVAVYFVFRKQRMCFANDRWTLLADNLWAIAKSIEAIRGLERWGTGEMVAAALQGYRALPPQKKPWRMVFGYGSDEKPPLRQVEAKYAIAAAAEHPDRGGDTQRMAELNVARDDARAELS